MLSLPPRRSGPPRQPVCDGPCCLHLHGCRLGLRGYHFRGHLCVRLRYGLETRPHPADEAVERLQKVGFPSPCAPSYRALAFPLVGLSPTDHASLHWTHTRACDFHRTRLTKEGPFYPVFERSELSAGLGYTTRVLVGSYSKMLYL